MSSSEDDAMDDEAASSVVEPTVAAEDSHDEAVAGGDGGSDLDKGDELDEDEPEGADEEDEPEGADEDVHDAVEDEEELEDVASKSEHAEEEGVESTEEPKKKSTPKRVRRKGFGGSKKGRAPAVKGLTIPFRAVKRTMKLDKDIATVQNEAAIAATYAAELFLKSLAKESHSTAKSHGRNTIRYEDVAEARTKNPALGFLDTLLP